MFVCLLSSFCLGNFSQIANWDRNPEGIGIGTGIRDTGGHMARTFCGALTTCFEHITFLYGKLFITFDIFSAVLLCMDFPGDFVKSGQH